MHTWRSLGYPAEFSCRNNLLCIKTGLKETAIKNTRNTLTQKERIMWINKGGSAPPKYIIRTFCDEFVYKNTDMRITQQKSINNNENYSLDTHTNSIGFENLNDENWAENGAGQFAGVKRPQNVPLNSPQTVRKDFRNAIPMTSGPISNLKNLKKKTNNNNDNDTGAREQIRVIMAHCNKTLGLTDNRSIADRIGEFLKDGAEPELIKAAIDKSVEYGAKNWVYAERILCGCITKGILTLNDFEKDSRSFKDAALKTGEYRNNVHNKHTSKEYTRKDEGYRKSRYASSYKNREWDHERLEDLAQKNL